VWVRMPVPTMETLLTSSSCSTVAPNSFASVADGERGGQLVVQDREADVGLAILADVLPIMSTTIFCSAMAEKTRWLTPGSSGTPSRPTRPRRG